MGYYPTINISLQEKSTIQANLVRKLSGYSDNQALTEYNWLIKAVYFLEYIDDASLRGYRIYTTRAQPRGSLPSITLGNRIGHRQPVPGVR